MSYHLSYPSCTQKDNKLNSLGIFKESGASRGQPLVFILQFILKILQAFLSISTRNVLLSVIPKKNRYSDTKTIKGERPSQPLIDYAFRFFPIF